MKTKKTLLFSLLVLIVCFGMFLGTTYAWFTDSVSSAGNIIQTGTLKVGMQWADGKSSLTESTEWKDASVGAIFNNKNWEPGYTEVKHIKISNNGSLALKYQVLIKPEGEVSKLADVIDVYYSDPATQVANRSDLNELEKLGTLTEVLAKLVETGSGVLEAGKADTITLALKMQEEVGNEYQNLKLCEGFAIQVVATQVNAEEDSFGSDYDKDVEYPCVSAPVIIPNGDVNEALTITENEVEIEMPSTFINNLSDEITKVAIVFAEPVMSNQSITFAYVDMVDQNGNKIDLSNNDEQFIVTIKEQTAFVPGTAIDIYHDGVKVATTSVAADGSISYSVTHLCEINITTIKDAYYVGTAEDFATEVYYGGTIVPTADITLPNYLLTFSDTEIYLNGKNITAENNFLFVAPAEGAKLTIKGLGTVSTTTGYAGYVEKQGILTIEGGTFNLGQTNNAAHFFTQNSGKTIINGGTFISNDENTPIIYCINGFVEINGGFFQNTANSKQALLSMGNNIKYVHNQKITLSGGTFVNWNPMDSAFAKPWTNPDVPALIVLADGYEMISLVQANGDIWYTVVPSNN